MRSSVPGCDQSPVIGISAEQRWKAGAEPAGSLRRGLPRGGTSGLSSVLARSHELT